MSSGEVVFYRSANITVTEHAVALPDVTVPIFGISSVSWWTDKDTNTAKRLLGVVVGVLGGLMLCYAAYQGKNAPLGHSAADESIGSTMLGLIALAAGICVIAVYSTAPTYVVNVTTHSGETHGVSFTSVESAAEFKQLIEEIVAFRTGGPPPKVRHVASAPAMR